MNGRRTPPFTQCQETFFKYLGTKGVTQTPYSDGFLKAAKEYLKRTPGAFEDYLKSDFVPFHLRISGTCERRAAGDVLGEGLLRRDDSCFKGLESEACDEDCCNGDTFSPMPGFEDGCAKYKERKEGMKEPLKVCG